MNWHLSLLSWLTFADPTPLWGRELWPGLLAIATVPFPVADASRVIGESIPDRSLLSAGRDRNDQLACGIRFAHEFTFDESYLYWGRFWFFAQLESRFQTIRKVEVRNESSEWEADEEFSEPGSLSSFEDANWITERRVLFDEEFPSWTVLHREWMKEFRLNKSKDISAYIFAKNVHRLVKKSGMLSTALYLKKNSIVSLFRRYCPWLTRIPLFQWLLRFLPPAMRQIAEEAIS